DGPACPPSAARSRPSRSCGTAVGRRPPAPPRRGTVPPRRRAGPSRLRAAGRARARPPGRRRARGSPPRASYATRVRDDVIAARYRLDERLGAGSTSEVWAARDLELDRCVALKLLARAADPVRFRREARAIAGLSHPNVCTLYDFGETDGRPFIVLEYLPGGSLDDRIPDGRPLADEVTERIARELA